MNTIDVAVVGAGPTGLMLACELAMRGVRVWVLEERSDLPNITRAFGLHARTLEVLDPFKRKSIDVDELLGLFDIEFHQVHQGGAAGDKADIRILLRSFRLRSAVDDHVPGRRPPDVQPAR